MTTLTQVAQTTRKLIILLIFLSVIGGFVILIISSIKKSVSIIKPAPPPVISTIFDKVPRAEFPEQSFPSDIKFSIETISGKLPEASPTAKIYFIEKKQQSLLTNIKTNQDARKLGFTNPPQVIEKKLLFKEQGKELVIDPISRDFIYTYDYLNDNSVFTENKKLTETEAVSIARTFLNLIDGLPKDYDSQNIQTTLLTFNGSQFIPLGGNEDKNNATSIRVDFFRSKINNLKVVTPKYDQGNIYVIVSRSKDINKQVIKAERKYQEISYENFGVYPLQNINKAWEEFTKGNGYIANPGNSLFSKRAVIRDGFLAYYDNPEKQSYLIPVYVFTGDNGFVGFVNALSPEWLK